MSSSWGPAGGGSGHQDLGGNAGVDRPRPRRGFRRRPGRGSARPGSRRGVLDLVQDPATLAADPAAAHVEDLDGRLELVFGRRDHVAVGAVRRAPPPASGSPAPAPAGRHERRAARWTSSSRAACSRPRPRTWWQSGHQASHEVAEVLGEHAVLLRADPLDARRGALADGAERRPRPPISSDRLNTPSRAGCRTGNTRSSMSTVSRMAQAWLFAANTWLPLRFAPRITIAAGYSSPRVTARRDTSCRLGT